MNDINDQVSVFVFDGKDYQAAPEVPRVGEDFKDYFITHDMPSVLEKLRSGLDAKSLSVIEGDIRKFLNYPSWAFGGSFFCKSHYDLLSSQDKEKFAWEGQEIRTIQERIGAVSDDFNVPSLVYAHGLREPDLPKSVIGYIKGKSFVDGGAGIGDSAFALSAYEPFRVYSFEIDPIRLTELRKNVAVFDKSNLVEIVPMALFSHSHLFSFKAYGHGGTSLFEPGEDKVEGVALDSFFDVHRDEVLGFLKADIEGAETDMLEGARGVIFRDRPVLNLGMDHRAEHYFGMKPLLESWDLDYKFCVRSHCCEAYPYETSLIAYPAELEG